MRSDKISLPQSGEKAEGVAAFSRMTADLSVGVFPKEPAVPKRLLEDVALIRDAGREIIFEIPAIPQQARIVDTQTFATSAARRPVGLITMQPRSVVSHCETQHVQTPSRLWESSPVLR